MDQIEVFPDFSLSLIQRQLIMSATSSQDIKALIEDAVKEVMEEKMKENDQRQGYPIPKLKANAKLPTPKVKFDESRKMVPTSSSDPRMGQDQWPCMGTHTEVVSNNRWGKWHERHAEFT